MTKRGSKNIAASVRQRLLNKARADNRPFTELLQYYAMERFLYRLSKSSHVKKFVLKGALLQMVWQAPLGRPTMDIDMLGKTSNQVTEIGDIVREVCSVNVEPDGIAFDLASIKGERIVEGAEYEGIRIRLSCKLDTAVVRLQIDIGFGDVVFPGPEMAKFPSLLDHPSPRLMCYSRESTIAEKFEAMVSLGELNSRMKDFYDIWLLARQFDFDKKQLAEAVARTFRTRGTALPDEIIAFSDAFVNAKEAQWKAFRRKLKQETIPAEFAEIVLTVEEFLKPVIGSMRSNQTISGTWKASRPWN